MIASVTTLKDNLPNVQRFVEANLASGIDHLFVFLDARDETVSSWLESRPEVTLVVTDKAWWDGKRPQLLNKRQRVNANLAKALLAYGGWADWLFHIDADEVAQIDRDALAQVPASEQAVRLTSMEAVSVMEPAGVPTQFKRLLSKPELELLWSLGLLDDATNALYFRSHIIGKIGARPTLDTFVKIHNLANAKGHDIKPARVEGLNVLHYESWSGAQFIRKWKAMLNSGPSVHFGPHRQRLADGMKQLLALPLAPEVAERYLTEIYERHMADPVATLDELGLLVTVDPLQGGHTPQLPSEADRAQAKRFIEAMRPIDKRGLLPEQSNPRQVRRLVDAALRAV